MRSLDLHLINYEIELVLTWSKHCIISDILNIFEVPAKPAAIPTITGLSERFKTDATFQRNNAKRYVLVVTLSINDNIKFSENIRQRFKKQFLGTIKDLIKQHNPHH